jgi:hypothetical protein
MYILQGEYFSYSDFENRQYRQESNLTIQSFRIDAFEPSFGLELFRNVFRCPVVHGWIVPPEVSLHGTRSWVEF